MILLLPTYAVAVLWPSLPPWSLETTVALTHLISYGIVLCDISCRTATTTNNNNPNYKPCAAPWLTKLANAVLTGRLVERQVDLARDAVDNLQRLGPTYIKLGQIMSIRCVT